MKLIFKYSFRNLVRTPLRSLLYFLTIFVSVLTVILCGKIYGSAKLARENFSENYPFVATVMVRPQLGPEGIPVSFNQYFSLDHLELISGSDQVVTANIDIPVGFLAEDEIIKKLPSNELLESDSFATSVSNDIITVRAINTPYLVSEFISGRWTLTSGEWFTEEQLRGGHRVMLISESIAEKYGFAVGDKIIYRPYLLGLKYAEYTVVGIFNGESTMYSAYMPLEDYFRECDSLRLNNLHMTSEMMNNFQISRIDLLLQDKNSGEKLIRYADAAGLDMAQFEIAINDKAFKTIDDGLSSICRIAVTVLVSVCLTAVAILALLSAFYHLAKQKEKNVLCALGMPRGKVTMVIVCEVLTLIILATVAGGIVGSVGADFMISYVDGNILSNYQQEAQEGESFAETLLSTPIQLTLRQSEAQTASIPYLPLGRNNPDGHALCRREMLYIDEEAVDIIGVESADIVNFKNSTSHSEDILTGNRRETVTFECYVPEASSYKINEKLNIFTQDPTGGVELRIYKQEYVMLDDGGWGVRIDDELHYSRTVLALDGEQYSAKQQLVVVGYFDPEDFPEGTDIVMALDELELLYQYCTVTSENYRGNRYELWEDVCSK